jgi:cytochrome c biogenesis protein CcmG, thiol:disulfide interchange protein DsbE
VLRSRFVVALTAASAGIVGCGGSLADGPSPTESGAAAGLLGDRAPDFRVTPIGGGRAPVSLEALRGGVVVLDFWGTYCGPCKESFPKLEGLHEKYATKGLHVVGISEDEPDDKDKIPRFAGEYGAKFTIGWDEDKSIARRYRPETMPSTFVIDRKGVVRFVHVGYRDGDDVALEKEVKDLLAE